MFYLHMRELTKIHLEENPEVYCRSCIGIIPYIALLREIQYERRDIMKY